MKEKIIMPNPDTQPREEKETEEKFFDGLTNLVKDTYCQRSGKNEDDPLIKDNIDHVKQVGDNVGFIVEEMKAGRIKEDFMPKDENGRAVFDEKLLKTMAVLHDAAKIDESGKLDTFGHHDRAKLEKLLLADDMPLNKFLKNNGFSDEEIKLMIDGIETHSRRTDFIYRKFAKEGQNLSRLLPRPEGVLEFIVLSDADILTQSKLDQGVKKIVSSRLLFDGFRKEDAVGGRHSFAKTLDSVIDSAKKVSEAMRFELTKNMAASQVQEAEEFVKWLVANGKIQEIDALDDFSKKKTRFDELIGEFSNIKKEQPEDEEKLAV